MPITIHEGDIFSVEADALVIPGNMQPDLNWGSHIAERVGKMVEPKVVEERLQFGKVPLGEACMTSGEGSGFKSLIHASVLNKYDFNPLFLLRIMQRTSDETLRNAVANVRKIAEEREFGAVAISAMGAGIGGMNYRKCCEITFLLLHDSSIDWRFAAFKAKHYQTAVDVLENIGA